ncbi:hypothetical protein ANN_16043 [Periplaneta americana]|uniref:Helicase-associated domain-containing protein n=1 Tax=Periplaneta americana TaxID=6978 RepID=A0ABQ8SJ90_PERAM|nr:hypothetical protein ANN_16043 [Periplaneta americana]
MLDFMPLYNCRNKEEDDSEEDENLNKVVSEQYSVKTRNAIAQLSEKVVSFELIEELLKYIKSLNIAGAILVFIPGRHLIFALMQHLQHCKVNNVTNATVWASKTNLEQRKGRAGRVRIGFCFYLLSRARCECLDEHMTPEMFCTPLHELALSIKLLRLGTIEQFLSKAIQPPPIDAIVEAESLLKEMKCLDKDRELIPLGRILAKLPIEPRLGKMMILGCIFFCGESLATMVANSSTFPGVFTTGMCNKVLTYQQKR